MLRQDANSVKIAPTILDGIWTLTQAITQVPEMSPSAKIAITVKNNSGALRSLFFMRYADVDAGGDRRRRGHNFETGHFTCYKKPGILTRYRHLFETGIGEQQEHTGSFMYLSIPYFAAREYWLSRSSKHWPSVPATVESTHRSRGGYKETIRGELWYSYSLNGEEYSGRVVRDCGFSPDKINALTEGREHSRLR